jgi:hypothetical protein
MAGPELGIRNGLESASRSQSNSLLPMCNSRVYAFPDFGKECDDLPMKPLRYVVPVAMLMFTAWSACPAQNMTPSELRNMTPAEFQRHIDEEGPQSFVHRLVKDIDPHAPEEPNYDIVLEHVAEGDNGWLHAAAEIAPYTDRAFNQGLRVAVADALVVNPVGVLKMVGTEELFDDACSYPFVHQTDTYMQRHKREALAALSHVHQPALASRKAACRQQLMDVPTTTASDATRPSTEARN